MATVTRSLPVSNATWADEARPSRNFHQGGQLGLCADASESAFTYLYVQLPDKLRDPLTTLRSATLRLYAKDAWSVGSVTVTVKRTAERVLYSRLTWDHKPTVRTGSADVTQAVTNDGDLIEVDVTSLLATGLGEHWHGFRVEKGGTALRYLHSPSAGNDDYTPTLELEWSTALAAPTDLSPSAGHAVSLSHPVLRALDGWPEDADRGVDAFQVQINPSDEWASPAFDSGTVVTTEPELDLATTGYGGISDGQTRWWRCRVRTDGDWSQWSPGAEFRRVNKPNLTITNPAAPPNNFVAEWTPPFAWTFTGQESFRLGLARASRPDRVLHDSGRVNSAATSYTPPPGVLTVEDTDYILDLRCWDGEDREGTPGDPTYQRELRTFTFAEDPTPNPVTGFGLVQHDTYPDVLVNFTRTTAPDSFTLLRSVGGGSFEVVEDEVVPSKVLVSGTTYQIRDRTPPRNRELTYKVQAVVNRAASTNNPTAAITVVQYGIWLTDVDRDVTVHIAGIDGLELDLAESSAVYTPPGGERATLVRQGVRGYEGTISGVLTPVGGVSADEWETRLLSMRDRPNQPIRLSLMHENLRGYLRGITVRPSVDPYSGERACSFEFYQR